MRRGGPAVSSGPRLLSPDSPSSVNKIRQHRVDLRLLGGVFRLGSPSALKAFAESYALPGWWNADTASLNLAGLRGRAGSSPAPGTSLHLSREKKSAHSTDKTGGATCFRFRKQVAPPVYLRSAQKIPVRAVVQPAVPTGRGSPGAVLPPGWNSRHPATRVVALRVPSASAYRTAHGEGAVRDPAEAREVVGLAREAGQGPLGGLVGIRRTRRRPSRGEGRGTVI